MHHEAAGLTIDIGLGRKETHLTSDRSARQSILRGDEFACVSPSATGCTDIGV